jgi:hypothetical protein
MDKINTESVKPATMPFIEGGSGIPPQTGKPILDGNALHVGNGVPKNDGAGTNSTPEISEPASVSIFEMSEEQSQMFAKLLMKLLQLSGIMLETQAQNLKNRQSANENVYSSQLKAAEETLSKNRINAWVGIAAGGLTLAAAGFSVKQLSGAGSKTTEVSGLSKKQTGLMEEQASLVSKGGKLNASESAKLKNINEEIETLGTQYEKLGNDIKALKTEKAVLEKTVNLGDAQKTRLTQLDKDINDLGPRYEKIGKDIDQLQLDKNTLLSNVSNLDPADKAALSKLEVEIKNLGNQSKTVGREIDQLNTKAQTITAGANAMGNTANASGQMAASQSEYEAAANEALANLQRKGAESIDQAVSSNQSVFDKMSSEMVASLKSVMMAAVR